MTTWNLKHLLCDRRRIQGAFLGVLLGATTTIARPAQAQDPFVDSVVSFAPGTSAGFGATALPDIVLGPPRGAGQLQGSFDIVSLGIGGSIVLRFDTPMICDGPGPDFTVFENAFHSGSAAGPLFAEYGFVAVSQDGVNFIQFPHDAVTHIGLAGQQPVLSHPDNGIDPLDPAVSGGDPFDLSTVGLAWAAYVRITDVAGTIPDTGDLPQFSVPPSAGFDLDAIAALHACDPGTAPSPTPSSTPSPLPPTATATFSPTATATATAGPPAPQHDAVVVGRRPQRLRIRRGQLTGTTRLRIKVGNADASGEVPIRLDVTACSAVAVSVDFDRRTDGAQDTTLVRARRARAAIVSLTVSSTSVTTPNRFAPILCLLTFTSSAAVPGNIDPTPGNNAAAVELGVLDLNDVE